MHQGRPYTLLFSALTQVQAQVIAECLHHLCYIMHSTFYGLVSIRLYNNSPYHVFMFLGSVHYFECAMPRLVVSTSDYF